jgi:hypothetical protein
MGWLESPRKATECLRALDDKAIHFTGEIFSKFPIFFLILNFTLLFLIHRNHPHICITVITITLLGYLYQRSVIDRFYPVLLLSAFFYVVALDYFVRESVPAVYFLVFLLSYFLPFFLIILTRRWSLRIRFILLCLLLFFECGAIYKLELYTGDGSKIFYVGPLRLFFIYSYVIFEDKTAPYSLKKPTSWIRVFNPISMIVWSFRRDDLKLKKDHRVFVRGLKNIYFSTIFYLLLLVTARTAYEGFAGSIANYLLVYFKIASVLYYFFGLLQVCGFDMTDPFDFPYLAHNPLERWKRWNVYNARWYRNMIFVSFYRWTGKIFLSLLGLFTVFTLLHLDGIDFGKLVTGDFDQMNRHKVIGFTITSALHLVVMYLAFLVPSAFGKDDKKSGWFGVLLTWVLLIIVYSYRPLFK